MAKRKKAKSNDRSLTAGIRRHGIRVASEMTGIPESTIRRACLSGELRFLRASTACNAKIMIGESDLLAWLKHCEQNREVLSPTETRAMRGRIAEEN